MGAEWGLKSRTIAQKQCAVCAPSKRSPKGACIGMLHHRGGPFWARNPVCVLPTTHLYSRFPCLQLIFECLSVTMPTVCHF